jgi:hypothetical protein
MKELATFIEIDAKPDVVWPHVAGFRQYADWNPFIIGLDGHPAVGGKVTVTMRLKTQDGRNQANHVITPRVIKVEHEHEIRWEHGAWLPGMLRIEHWFRLTQRKGGVKFHQCMRAEGLMTTVLKDDYFAMFREGFNAMNAALKARVETHAPPVVKDAPIANDNAGMRAGIRSAY